MVESWAVGERIPGYTFPVERGKIREYARATMAELPEYVDDPEPLIPPTWLVSSLFWAPPEMRNPAAGLDFELNRVLHASQEFVFHGPPPKAGDVLTTELWLDKRYEKAGRRGGTLRFAEVVTEFRDQTGRVVAHARMTMIETARAATEAS